MASNVNMFSFLPESLLIVIVSFLPFKEAARTCTLSKRWLKIWQSTRNIEFNELFFVKLGESDETKEGQRRVFLDFITHFIANYKDKFVDKFSLKVSHPRSCDDSIKRCVAFATHRGVRELRLDFSDPSWEENDFQNRDALFQLPNHVYKHESLETLKMYSCGFAMPDLLNFKALKNVSLGWIEVNISTLKTLLSTCKKIENLSLKKCWNLVHFDMGEEELGLRRLVIDKCNFVGDDYFVFRAPNLTFLKYSGLMGVFEIDVRPYVMEEADIDFALMPHFEECGDLLCKLLHDLSSVRVLTVCSFLLQAIPSGEEPVRIQCDMNVRHLIMKTQMHHFELCGFMFLLNSCALLEKLTLEIGQRKIFRDYKLPYRVSLRRFWEQDLIVFECLRRTLKVVEVKGFRGMLNEIQACSYLIQAGSVLEQVTINVLKDESDGSERVEKRYANAKYLLTVPKASENLQILIA
ncbi:putative F-box/LRR-repeat protein At1g56400 [Abrus precatorius]|uniref:F-box/LRR-repeat protein At1g56400 n=1 Tax=Abrus precatorius TaxID=3816 RepID=A0A8B8MA08_ABRPR|nr:putative F-box/LRR-repeat protein At1g56400 [Abrus precatorius]